MGRINKNMNSKRVYGETFKISNGMSQLLKRWIYSVDDFLFGGRGVLDVMQTMRKALYRNENDVSEEEWFCLNQEIKSWN